MNRRSASPVVRQVLVALVTLGAIHQTAPWPGLQSALNALLALGLAPEFKSPLIGMLWAAAAGWVLEGSLRIYSHLGGTALANMTVCLLVQWSLLQWPPRERKPFWIRMAIFAVLQMLLIHMLVRIAAGPHPWGTGPIWTLVTVPFWATLAFRLYQPHYRS